MKNPRTWSPSRRILGLSVLLVAALVLLHGLEGLVGRTSPPAPEPSPRHPAVRPILERENDSTIVIREDAFRRSTYRLDGVEAADRVYACLEAAIAREFDDNPTTSHREMRERTRKIRDECSPIELPTLPPLPDPDSEAG